MTMDLKKEGAPPSPPRSLELALRPRWRRAHRVLTWCFVPAIVVVILGPVPGWASAPFFAVASARAAVGVLGQRFTGPRIAGAVELVVSLVATVLSLLLVGRRLTPDAYAALTPATALMACIPIWGISAVVCAFLTKRALQAEERERQ